MSEVVESGTPSIQEIVERHSNAPAPEAAVEETAPVEDAVEPESSEPVVEEAPKPPKKDPASARFGALAKKERELRNQMSEFDRKMKEFEARETAVREREMRFQVSKRPLEKLKELGFTYADVTQDLLGNYSEPEIDPLDEKLKPHKERWDKFEGVSEKLAKEVEELKTQLMLKEQKETYGKVLNDIQEVLKDNEKYELTNTMGKEGLDLIQEVIVEYFNENEILLDYSAACDIVEQYYEDQIMSKVIGTKKLKSRLQPEASPAPAKATPKTPATKAPSAAKTLTQAHTTGTQATVDVDKLSKSEALAYLSKKLLYKQD